MTMKRSDCYEALYKIKEERNVNIQEQLDKLYSSTQVPNDVVEFIEQNSQRTLDDFINVISKTKKFYKSLFFNYTNDTSEYVKGFLSLLTHIIITIDRNTELRKEILDIFPISDIINVVERNLIFGDNADEVCQMAETLRKVFIVGSAD